MKRVYQKLCRGCMEAREICWFRQSQKAPDGLSKRCSFCVVRRDAKGLAVRPIQRFDHGPEFIPLYLVRLRAIRLETLKRDRIRRAGGHAAFLDREQRRSFANRVRSLIAGAIERGKASKTGRTEEILGCSFSEFRAHIERQFLPGMGWDNRAAWHIDHIVPIASARHCAEVMALNHFTNLRPLWARDNLKKSDHITHLL